AHASTSTWRRGCWSWRVARRAPASASPSMPKRRIGSTCRSTSWRRSRGMRRRAPGRGSDLRYRPTAAAHRWCSTGWRRWPAGAAYAFQRLHGMGEALYEAAHAEVPALPPVRVYAPVGTHEDLLPYLVRRLLENGANSSFVHQFMNPQIPVEQVVRDPVSSLT